MADKLLEQDRKATYRWQLSAFVERLLVFVQITLVVLTVWALISLYFHISNIKKEVTVVRKMAGDISPPVWFSSDTDRLRENVALEYLLMSTTSTGMIIVIPDDR